MFPFSLAKFGAPASRYPSLIQTPGRDQPEIVFDKADADEFKEELDLAYPQEMKRLLYVALTRTKHTLVLVG